jgi:hypothetical protein
MLKRLTAFALIIALTGPLGLFGEAEADTTITTLTREHSFTSTAERTAPLPAAGNGIAFIDINDESRGTMFTPTFDPNIPGSPKAAWAYAGMVLLENAADGVNIKSTDTPANGNRSTLTAHLMNVHRNGPFETAFDDKNIHRPVTGVVYIPGSSRRSDFIANVKNAVAAHGAVAVSLFYADNRYYSRTDNDETVYLYHNVAQTNANHTVIITGWNDDMSGVYSPVHTDAADITLVRPGAFRVLDSNKDEYWVSYSTPLTGAHYIEGIHEAFSSNSNREGNDPIGHTYQRDENGFISTVSTGTATAISYANVFNTINDAFSLQAVSVFLPGENNQFRVGLIRDFDENDNTKNLNGAIDWIIPPATRPFPGYYTLPLPSGLTDNDRLLKNKQFAVVVEITSYTPITGSGVPVSNTSAGGNSWMIRNGNWVKTTNAVCIKAHAERYVDIPLTGVELTKNDKDGDDPLTTEFTVGSAEDTYDLLSAAPNQQRTIRLEPVPQNANDYIASETTWRVYMKAAPRDSNGWLEEDSAADPDKWEYDWLVWHEPQKIFALEGQTFHSDWRDGYYEWDTIENKLGEKADGYIGQPITAFNANNPAAVTFRASNEPDFHGWEILFEATARTGFRDKDWIFEKNAAPNDKEYKINNTKKGEVVVRITPVGITGIRLNRTTNTTMRAGATMNFNAILEPSNASRVKVTWGIVGDRASNGNPNGFDTVDIDGTEYIEFADHNPRDPFAQANGTNGGPAPRVAVVDSEGRVTALRDGTFHVYAKVGSLYSFCRITVAQQAVTGITVSRRRHTMSVDTTVTINAAVRPAGASNRGVTWEPKPGGSRDESGTVVEDNAIVRFTNADDDRLGIITAVAAGTAVLTVTPDSGTRVTPVEVTITVTNMPSATVRLDRNATYSILGAGNRDEVKWDFVQRGVDDPITDFPSNFPFTDRTQQGIRFRVRASEEGPAYLRGRVLAKDSKGDIMKDANGQEIFIREQIWYLESVIPISRLSFMQGGDPVRRLDLGIKKGDITAGEPIQLIVEDTRNTDSTLLDFEWTVRTRRGQQPLIAVSGGKVENGVLTPVTIHVAALTEGSNRVAGNTRLIGTNHNGRKRVSLSVRVMIYPDATDIKTRGSSIVLTEGRAAGVRARVTLKGGHRDLVYQLVQGEDPESRTVTASHPSVTLDTDRFRLEARAVTEGQEPVFLRIVGAPGLVGGEGSDRYDPVGKYRDIPITVNPRR